MTRILTFITIIFLSNQAFGQALTLDFGGEDGATTSRILQIIALITVLSLAPSVLIVATSFTRLIVVFSFLRSALGLQQTPPNTVLISLALFMTLFIMYPVFTESYDNGIKPMIDEEITEQEAVEPTIAPFKNFMIRNVRDKDLMLFANMADVADSVEKVEDVPIRVLVPAFMISELRRAFEIGFLIYIPFLIIDLVVASTLMAMGMMMLPPVIISLPFKLIFFVLIDGWYVLVGSLMQSFSTG